MPFVCLSATIERLVDYARHTPADPLRSAACVAQRRALIERNLKTIEATADEALHKVR